MTVIYAKDVTDARLKSYERFHALYVRVSTEEQAREGYSIETQINRLTAYAGFNGWPLVIFFVDEGESAKDMNRPAMRRLIKFITMRKVNAVVTLAVDRLSRNLLDMLQFIKLCEEHSAAYVCATLNFDTSTPIGRMVLQILAAFAEFERSMISTRVKTNMLDIVQHQKRYMGPPPFGYMYNDEKKLEIVPEEAEWIRKAADMFIAGHGYRGVATWLSNNNVKTKDGKLWEPSTVRYLLTNELYIGRLIWNRSFINSQGKAQLRDPSEWVVIEDAHPAILSMQQWDAIQKRITRRMPKGGQKQAKRRLSGLMRCGYCGATMVSKKYGTFGPHKDQNIFICSTYQKKASCQFNYAFVDDVDRAVYEALDDLAGGNIDIPEEDLAGASKNLEDDFARRGDAIDQHFQRQIMAFEKGLIFERDLALARDRVEKEREHLEEEKKRVDHGPNRQEIVKAITGQAKQLLWLWENGELAVIQNAVRLILDSVVVKDGQVIDIRLSKELFSPE